MQRRVLHILSSTMRAGVEMMVMNLYRQIDREELQFDFIVHDIGSDDLGAEIESLGGRVFRIPLLTKTGISGFVQTVRNIIEQNGPYAAVHAHTDYQGGFSALAAKQAGVPVRVCHAHSDTRVFRSLEKFIKIMLGRLYIDRYATQRCACSQNAALSLFGKYAVKKGRVQIIRNSIDLDAYKSHDPGTREALLKNLGADEPCKLIGFVGRLHPIKNPAFVLYMAAEAQKRNMQTCFIMVGAGGMAQELLQKQRSLGLEKTVLFTGTREDIPELMQSFDLVVVPSLTEGFSMTALESQAAGTPVLAVPCVPQEADMGLGLISRLPLCAGADGWLSRSEEIMNAAVRPDAAKRIAVLSERGYDARDNVAALMQLYGLQSRALTPSEKD
jgi:glycosyltransferase EpsF